MPDIPQLAFPLRVVNGQLATVEQDSVDDVVSQAYVLCLTPQGWLTSNRDFGLYEQAHLEGGADVDEIERQISEHVLAGSGDALVEGEFDALNPALSIVGVRIGA